MVIERTVTEEGKVRWTIPSWVGRTVGVLATSWVLAMTAGFVRHEAKLSEGGRWTKDDHGKYAAVVSDELVAIKSALPESYPPQDFRQLLDNHFESLESKLDLQFSALDRRLTLLEERNN